MVEYVVEVVLVNGERWVRSFPTEKDATKWIKELKKTHKSTGVKDLKITTNQSEINNVINKLSTENKILRLLNDKRSKFMNDFGFSRAYLKPDSDFEEIKRIDEIEKIENELKEL